MVSLHSCGILPFFHTQWSMVQSSSSIPLLCFISSAGMLLHLGACPSLTTTASPLVGRLSSMWITGACSPVENSKADYWHTIQHLTKIFSVSGLNFIQLCSQRYKEQMKVGQQLQIDGGTLCLSLIFQLMPESQGNFCVTMYPLGCTRGSNWTLAICSLNSLCSLQCIEKRQYFIIHDPLLFLQEGLDKHLILFNDSKELIYC